MSKRVFVLAHDQARRGACAFIQGAPQGFVVEVKEPARNLAANAALHASLGEVSDRVQWAGALQSIETWKRLMVAAWSRAHGEQTTILPAIDGHGIDVVFRRTSSMRQPEVRDLLEFIEAWKAERPEFN